LRARCAYLAVKANPEVGGASGGREIITSCSATSPKSTAASCRISAFRCATARWSYDQSPRAPLPGRAAAHDDCSARGRRAPGREAHVRGNDPVRRPLVRHRGRRVL